MGRDRVAVVVCDMWDTHWCNTMAAGIESLAPRIDSFLGDVRHSGGLVIHAPSQTDLHYASWPQYQRAMRLGQPIEYARPLPGEPSFRTPVACPCARTCDPPDASQPWPWPWRRQHDSILVADDDFIVCDSGEATLGAYRASGASRLVICGVHLDSCVMDRAFGVKAMWQAGIDIELVRDLTGATHPARTSAALDEFERFFPSCESRELT